ncbi:hypothetical protein F8388_027317, partial [Cannabis sativa]
LRAQYSSKDRTLWKEAENCGEKSFSFGNEQAIAMSREAYASRNPNEIHTDVLSEARKACHKARDSFYACLEEESEKKPTEIASAGLLYPSECKATRAAFVKLCRSSWVNHFDRLYCKNKRVNRLLDDRETRRGPLGLVPKLSFGCISFISANNVMVGMRLHLAPDQVVEVKLLG